MTTSTGSPASFHLVFLSEGADLPAGAEVAADDFTGKADSSLVLYPADGPKRLVLLGLGASPDVETLRKQAGVAARLAAGKKATTVSVQWPDLDLADADVAEAIAEGLVLGGYRFDRYRTTQEEPPAIIEALVWVGAPDGTVEASEQGRILGEATSFARDLVNTSPGDQSATDLAMAAKRSADAHGYEAQVWSMGEIIQEGMGGLLAVNRGSEEPPTFTRLEWKPADAVNEQPIVLVGKGIVFDTGGLSLKPSSGMEKMKGDMGGAAAVIGGIEAVARLKLPVWVIALVPSTDNRPGKNAYVPGEVITMHSGATVEVLNTDAEGRMILADALSFAKRFEPELVIDFATLTGAQVIALGPLAAAIMTNEDDGAEARTQRVIDAGQRSGDRVWPLPMFAGYKKLLESDVADLKNVGGRAAGTITAGKFLEHFTDYPWVHVDIAGPSFANATEGYATKGGTGFGVRLIARMIQDRALKK
ncbi:MAG: leucyl aminopeptidase [Bacteroidota bacterium]